MTSTSPCAPSGRRPAPGSPWPSRSPPAAATSAAAPAATAPSSRRRPDHHPRRRRTRAAAPTSSPGPRPRACPTTSASPSPWRTSPAPTAPSPPRSWPARTPTATRSWSSTAAWPTSRRSPWPRTRPSTSTTTRSSPASPRTTTSWSTAPDSGFTTVEDLAAAGRPINFGTTGVGTGSQLSQELLFAQADIDATAVPFDGGSPTLTAVLGGQVDVGSIQLGEAIEQIEAGELTADRDVRRGAADLPARHPDRRRGRLRRAGAAVARGRGARRAPRRTSSTALRDGVPGRVRRPRRTRSSTRTTSSPPGRSTATRSPDLDRQPRQVPRRRRGVRHRARRSEQS